MRAVKLLVLLLAPVWGQEYSVSKINAERVVVSAPELTVFGTATVLSAPPVTTQVAAVELATDGTTVEQETVELATDSATVEQETVELNVLELRPVDPSISSLLADTLLELYGVRRPSSFSHYGRIWRQYEERGASFAAWDKLMLELEVEPRP